MRYKVIYDEKPKEVTYYVKKIDEELCAGIKVLPIPSGYLGLASKSSSHKTTIQQCKQLSKAINLLVENEADLLKLKDSPSSPALHIPP